MFRNPTTDLIVILVIVLLVFGPKRLPGLGKSLGQGIRDFKDSVTGGDSDDEEPPAQIPAAPHSTPMSGEQRPADTSASERRA